MWCGTKEEGRKAIQSIFGQGNKWGYSATGKIHLTSKLDFGLTKPNSEVDSKKLLSISVDLPGVPLWQTLLDEFPEAKVVLVIRDENKWIQSAMNHTHVRILELRYFSNSFQL